MGWPFCKNILIAVKASRDLRKESDWFRRKKNFVEVKIFRSQATVSLFHKFTSPTQGDEETRTRQNTVIYHK